MPGTVVCALFTVIGNNGAFDPLLNIIFERNENILEISVNSVMDGFDKGEVLRKLREMGMDSVANKLERMSDKEIERLLISNPQILKKAAEILGGRR